MLRYTYIAYLVVFVFYGLFNDAVCTPGSLVLNSWNIIEYFIGKNLEGNTLSLIRGVIQYLSYKNLSV
jgi:hypothetical protein